MPMKQGVFKDKALTFKCKMCASDKLKKDGMTVMLSAYIDGNEDLILLAIGKETKTHYLKELKHSLLIKRTWQILNDVLILHQ